MNDEAIKKASRWNAVAIAGALVAIIAIIVMIWLALSRQGDSQVLPSSNPSPSASQQPATAGPGGANGPGGSNPQSTTGGAAAGGSGGQTGASGPAGSSGSDSGAIINPPPVCVGSTCLLK